MLLRKNIKWKYVYLRFDFEKPFPHENPHAHIEELINGEWIDHGDQIYPNDVPKK